MNFIRPEILLLLLTLPAWWLWRRKRPRPGAVYSDVSLARQLTTATWLSRIPPASRAIALAAWIIAAAGPRIGGTQVEEKKEGISIVIAVDISSSMLAEDFAPSNRMEVAKAQAIAFIRGRTADRIGIVAFAGEALTQVPITTDYAVLERSVMDLKIGMLEDGTAIGTGLATAINRLRQAPGKTKVILLLTDGVNNRGTVDPRTAAAAAQALGIKVYTIGVGTEGEAPIPTGRGLSGFRYEILPVEIDEPLLNDIATSTGGRYFRARDSEALTRILKTIDGLEKSPVHVMRYVRYDEMTLPFILIGLGALATELLLAATLVVRIP